MWCLGRRMSPPWLWAHADTSDVGDMATLAGALTLTGGCGANGGELSPWPPGLGSSGT